MPSEAAAPPVPPTSCTKASPTSGKPTRDDDDDDDDDGGDDDDDDDDGGDGGPPFPLPGESPVRSTPCDHTRAPASSAEGLPGNRAARELTRRAWRRGHPPGPSPPRGEATTSRVPSV
jgi:hypothetical protein